MRHDFKYESSKQFLTISSTLKEISSAKYFYTITQTYLLVLKFSNPKMSSTPIALLAFVFGLYIALLILLTIRINRRPYMPFTKASLTSTDCSRDSVDTCSTKY